MVHLYHLDAHARYAHALRMSRPADTAEAAPAASRRLPDEPLGHLGQLFDGDAMETV